MIGNVSSLQTNGAYTYQAPLMSHNSSGQDPQMPPLLGSGQDVNGSPSIGPMADEGVALNTVRNQADRGLEPPVLPPLGLDGLEEPGMRLIGSGTDDNNRLPLAPVAQGVDLARRFMDNTEAVLASPTLGSM